MGMLAENIKYMSNCAENGFFKQPSGQVPAQTAYLRYVLKSGIL